MIKANEEKIIMSGHEGGWPFPDRIGVPLNPDRDGWHWISSWVHSPGWKERMPWCAKWIAERKVWAEVEVDELGSMADWTPARIASEFNYMAPCLTPSEISKLIEDAKEKARYDGQSGDEDDTRSI